MSGDFLVEAGASRDGGPLCPLPDTCSVIGTGVLDLGGRNVEWQLTNVGLETATIESIHLVWPEENGDLKKIKLDSKKIFEDRTAPPEAIIDGAWDGQVQDREIDKDETRTLKLEFIEDAAAGNAVCDCCGGDSDSDSDSGSDGGSDSDSGGGSDSDSGGSSDSDSGDDARGAEHRTVWRGNIREVPGAAWLDTRFSWLSSVFERLSTATHPVL